VTENPKREKMAVKDILHNFRPQGKGREKRMKRKKGEGLEPGNKVSPMAALQLYLHCNLFVSDIIIVLITY